MADAAVTNSSPLILLSRAELTDLLLLVAPTIWVPQAVANEIGQKGRNDAAVQSLSRYAWLVGVPDLPLPERLAGWELGAGEAAALARAASMRGCIAIVDERQARRCAAVLSIPTIGTLGLVLLAKRRGTIPAARPAIERLVAEGMYLSPKVLAQALALVGE